MTEQEIRSLPEGTTIRLKADQRFARALHEPGKLVFQAPEDKENGHEATFGIKYADGAVCFIFTADSYEQVPPDLFNQKDE